MADDAPSTHPEEPTRVVPEVTPSLFREIVEAGAVPRDPGERIGRYEIVREVGRGGMGTVYEARDPNLGRRIALKVVREGAAPPELILRLHREAALVAQLQHPGIIAIHEVGSAPDARGQLTHFIAMDFVEGTTLHEVLEDQAAPRVRKLEMLEEVARAVAHAHSRGIVHRDLKPGNVLVSTEGRVVLTDFGLARAEEQTKRLTRSHAVIGTPQYMAPEQVRGRSGEIDERTDVWALGVILYELLAVRLPFTGATLGELYQEILSREPIPPSRGPEADLAVIALKALEKEPAQRYPSAAAFAEELARVRLGEPIRARPIPTWRRIARRLRRNRAAMASLAMGGVVAVGAIAWIVLAEVRHEREVLAVEREGRARETFLRRLSARAWAIDERARELRQLRLPANRARAALAAAVAEVDQDIRERSEEPQAWYTRAMGRLDLGDLTGAEADLLEAIRVAPDFSPGWALLGAVRIEQFEKGRGPVDVNGGAATPVEQALLQSALDAFARAGQGATSDLQGARWGIARTRRQGTLETLVRALVLRYVDEKKDAAHDLLLAAVDEFHAEELAFWLGSLTSNPAKRIEWQSRAIAWAPGYARAWYDRGAVRDAIGEYAAAVADLDRVIEIEPDNVSAWSARASAKLGLRDWRGALDDADHAVSLVPAFEPAWINRGVAKHELGDDAGAREDFDHAIALRPDRPEGYRDRAVAEEGLGDLDGALTDYGHAIALREDYAGAWFGRGTLHVRRKEFADAVADLGQAIALKPTHAEAWSNRAVAREHLGEYDEAIEDCTQALTIRAVFPEALYTRGRCHARMGERGKAIEDLGRALEMAPADWRLRRACLEELESIETDQ